MRKDKSSWHVVVVETARTLAAVAAAIAALAAVIDRGCLDPGRSPVADALAAVALKLYGS